MNVALSWTPGANVISQLVKYKLATVAATPESNWTTFGNSLAANANSVTVTGLTDNVIYDFKIVSVCQNDITSSSPTVQQVKITCASVTITATSDTVNYNFTPVGGSVNTYSVQLLNAAGTSVLQTQTPSGSPNLSGSFTGLTGSTTYNIRVIQTAGSFTKNDCALSSFTTEASACNPATSLSATIAP